MWNYGGGVFFINDDFYIYTAKDYIEVRKNFTGKVTGDWLGKSRDTLMASFGEPSIMKNERYYYARPYGCLRFDLDKQHIRQIAVHATSCEAALKVFDDEQE